jgi:hypothetical protein
MFELLGVMSLVTERPAASLPSAILPAAQWSADAHYEEKRVRENGMQAVYLARPGSLPAHYTEGGVHIFVVGEVYQRLGKDGSLQQTPGPLPASEILHLHQAVSSGFLDELKGNFTILVLEPSNASATLYTGRASISPFYYAHAGGCLYFATSLAALAHALPSWPDLDPVALAEIALFFYPLGGRTYFRQVRKVQPGHRVLVSEESIRVERWWEPGSLYEQQLLSEAAATEQGTELFYRVVNDQTADLARLNVALTAGFDSRANLAVLQLKSYQCYSFGIPGSLNVTIPQRMARKLNLPYRPFLLDGSYEQAFDENAFRAVMLSDCLSTVERANYPYVFQQLGQYAPHIMTGLFGSELMRTFQNVGLMVSPTMASINIAADAVVILRETVAQVNKSYFAAGLLSSATDELEADVQDLLRSPFAHLSPDQRLYMILLTEAMRGYFGAELQMQRPYVVNRFPYLDDDFVAFLFRSPFAGVHSRTLRPTVNSRLRSQRFYALVIRKYRSELLSYPTDHGYPPSDLLSWWPLLKIGPKYVYHHWQRERTHYREFRTEEWTSAFYQRNLFRRPTPDGLFSPQLVADFETGAWKDNRYHFASAASLKLWLEMVGYDY